MWELRCLIARLLIGKDNEMASLCLLQCLRNAGKLPMLGEMARINHQVRNKADGRKVYEILVHGMLSIPNVQEEGK